MNLLQKLFTKQLYKNVIITPYPSGTRYISRAYDPQAVPGALWGWHQTHDSLGWGVIMYTINDIP